MPPGAAASAEQVAAEVMAKLRAHGEIFAFEKKMTFRDGSFRGIVEYCDVLAAKRALAQAPTSEGHSGIRIVLATHAEDESTSTGDSVRTSDTPRISDAATNWEYGPPSTRQNKIPPANIMLRNIPNKVDQAMLKRIVDESSWGKYDFMYLRIDFANDCNVGYAFINFVDVSAKLWWFSEHLQLTPKKPLDIIDFVEARGNQRWNCFKSDKVAEVSYATIQGKDCLVQKFRNSSVMLEAAHYRPKLYFTSNGPMPEMAGQEEQFPEPDNQSKMKRSCENAEHVGQWLRRPSNHNPQNDNNQIGLFTPNAGQHFRDEQRRRRSQYDRGTRLAALEEYDLEAIQHLYIGNERTE
ncbi:hypothetical protein V2A60_007055 [Cordyceps javanica]|nr:RNA recognition domain-containing protein 2 [Cordyceps javanica]